MARVPCIQYTKQASIAHHVKILVWSTKSLKKLRRKAQGARRLWPPCSDWTQKYFFEKVWESWWGMPQVKTSFSFNQQIHEKKCAERHRKLGGYSRQVSSRRKSEYLSMSVTTHLQYRKLIPFFFNLNVKTANNMQGRKNGWLNMISERAWDEKKRNRKPLMSK